MAETKKTYHEGAEAERKAFKAYLARQLKVWGGLQIPMILEWVKLRCGRYKKRKGGL